MCHFRCPWNGMFDCHQAEITVMQFTGDSLPVHQSMTVLWDFTSSHIACQCQWNMQLLHLWNSMSGRVDGQYTTICHKTKSNQINLLTFAWSINTLPMSFPLPFLLFNYFYISHLWSTLWSWLIYLVASNAHTHLYIYICMYVFYSFKTKNKLLLCLFIIYKLYIYYYNVFYPSYQPLRSDRIWHKVNF